VPPSTRCSTPASSRRDAAADGRRARLRRRAEQEEVNLSYTRRLLQGRLDIVRRELQRRAEHDGRSLVDLLPEILAEKGRGPAHGRGRHQTVQPGRRPRSTRAGVTRRTPGVDLSAVPRCPTPSWSGPARALAAAEGVAVRAGRGCAARSWTG
jgi:hypothetical protein